MASKTQPSVLKTKKTPAPCQGRRPRSVVPPRFDGLLDARHPRRALTGAPGTNYVGIVNEELRIEKDSDNACSQFSILNFQFSISLIRRLSRRVQRSLQLRTTQPLSEYGAPTTPEHGLILPESIAQIARCDKKYGVYATIGRFYVRVSLSQRLQVFAA